MRENGTIYAASLSKERSRTLVEFPDCPGCQTFVERGGDVEAEAREALEGWLEAHLATRRVPPPPSRKRAGPNVLLVAVSPRLAVKLQLRWARERAMLTQAQLGKRAGISQSAIAQLESPDSNPSIDTLVKVATALGTRLSVSFEPLADAVDRS